MYRKEIMYNVCENILKVKILFEIVKNAKNVGVNIQNVESVLENMHNAKIYLRIFSM